MGPFSKRNADDGRGSHRAKFVSGRSAELAWTNYLDYVGPTMVQMNIAEAKAKLSELVARAEAGEEVVIARDGVPAVRMAPAASPAKRGVRRLGFLAHLGPLENPDAALDDEDESEWGLDFTDTDPLRPKSGRDR